MSSIHEPLNGNKVQKINTKYVIAGGLSIVLTLVVLLYGNSKHSDQPDLKKIMQDQIVLDGTCEHNEANNYWGPGKCDSAIECRGARTCSAEG